MFSQPLCVTHLQDTELSVDPILRKNMEWEKYHPHQVKIVFLYLLCSQLFKSLLKRLLLHRLLHPNAVN